MNRIMTSVLASAILFSGPALVRADNMRKTDVKTTKSTDKKEKKDGSSQTTTEVTTDTRAKGGGMTDTKDTRQVKTKVKQNADGSSQTTTETKTKSDRKP